MEIDVEKFKQLVKFIMTNFKNLESELMAYQLTLAGIEQTIPEQARFFKVALELARNSGPLKKMMHEKYDEALEKFLQQADQEQLDPTVLKWFQEWKPTGQVN